MRSERFPFYVTFPPIITITNAGEVYDSTRFFAARLVASLVLIVGIAVTIGCGAGAGGDGASVDPSAAADKAMELFDKDGSGTLDESELAAAPEILSAHERYDTNGDKQISRDEIAARLKLLYSGAVPWVTVDARFLQGDRPLAGASVRFLPAPYLEDALEPASGTTDTQGYVRPAVLDEKLPDKLKGAHVMQLGVYRVEIEHPSIKQPHQPLGCDIDDTARNGTTPVFRL